MILALLLAASVPLAPTGPWSLSHDDRSCAISRPFGSDGSTTLLIERRVEGRWTVRLATSAPLPAGAIGPLTIALDPPGVRAATSGEPLVPPVGAGGAMQADLPNMIAEGARDDSILVIATPNTDAVQLSTTRLRAALDALTTCRNDILQAAGVDPAAVRQLGSPALRSALTTWENYPEEAWKRHIGGEAVVAFTVDAQGQAQGCRIVASAGNQSLDKASCRVFARKRFVPAQDETGAAVPATVIWSMTWTPTS